MRFVFELNLFGNFKHLFVSSVFLMRQFVSSVFLMLTVGPDEHAVASGLRPMVKEAASFLKSPEIHRGTAQNTHKQAPKL